MAKMRKNSLRLLGRYINPRTNRAVNVYKATDSRGFDFVFYYFRQSRVVIPDNNFWGKWPKEEPKP